MGWNDRAHSGGRGALLRTKPLDAILADSQKPEYQLRRALGPIQLTLLGIGAIIGAGIFATIGTAAAGDASRPGAGPALTVSFILTAITCGFTALCYAEFAAMVPISGSAYTYSYATLGEVVAWIIGWDLIIEYAVGNVAVAISWANYFKTLLQNLKFQVGSHVLDLSVKFPDWLSTDFRTATQQAAEAVKAGKPTIFETAPHLFGYPIVLNVLAIGIIAALTLLLIWGVKESARFNAAMVCVKILVLSFFIVIGLMWMPTQTVQGGTGIRWIWPTNWTPFNPNGWAGISAGAAVVFFAYIGFDAVSTVAEETRNPQRNLPIGIIASLIICTIFYIAVSVIFTGLMPYNVLVAKQQAEQAEPLTMAIEYAHPGAGWAVGLVAFGSVIAHTAVLLVYQLGQPRIFFSMARDGLLPQIFAKVHPRFRTPHVSTILTGVFVAVFAAFASIDEMVDLTNIGTLFAFILVCAGIMVLRIKDPARPRPFRVPGGTVWTVLLYACLAGGLYLLTLPSGAGVAPTLSMVEYGGILAVAAVVFLLGRNHIFPLLGILSCLYLIYYLPPNSWLRFAAWLNVGLVVYVGYGAVHSRLTGRHGSDRPAAHDLDTAYHGAWLALAGVGVLLLMHLLTAALEAFKHEPNGSRLVETAAALRSGLQPEAWLGYSWFLIVPLALNAFLLCPIVLARAARARSAFAGAGGRAAFSVLSSLALALGTVWYLVLIAKHQGRL